MARQCGFCSGETHLILKVEDWELWLCDRCKKVWFKDEKGMMNDRVVISQDFALALQIMGLETGKTNE